MHIKIYIYFFFLEKNWFERTQCGVCWQFDYSFTCNWIQTWGLSIAFSPQDNKDLYAEEAAAQRERERQRMLSIPGLIAPSELQDEMVDS